MTLNEYQKLSQRTLNDSCSTPLGLAILAIGLTGEAGETADLLKKHLGHGHELDKAKVALEMGDTLFYLAGIATVLGISLDDVAAMNVAKLRARYPNGFEPERSINREGEE